MIRVGVLGATGRMGRRVLDLIAQAEDLSLGDTPGRDALVAGCFDQSDLVVDFSLPAGLAAAVPHLGPRPLVSGTTALPVDLQQTLDQQAARAPVLQAANFSVGVNLMLDLVTRAAQAMPQAHIDILEAHHAGKVDAPSGTALALGAAAVDREVSYHAVRAGDIIGSHQVWLCATGERIELHHHATNRDLFAHGALTACRWIVGRNPGRYDMRAVLGLH